MDFRGPSLKASVDNYSFWSEIGSAGVSFQAGRRTKRPVA